LRSIDSGQYDCIVPVVVGTVATYLDAPEPSYGPAKPPEPGLRSETVRLLKRAAEGREAAADGRCHLLNVVHVASDPRVWAETIRRTEASWRFDTGSPEADLALMSPCVPCHVYVYYSIALLCQALGIRKMIGGDRVVHDQVVKVNQMECVLESIRRSVSQEFGVEFTVPLKEIADGREVRKSLDARGIRSIYDISCVFDGQAAISLEGYRSLGEETMTLISERIETQVIPGLRTTLHERCGPIKSR
jgi:hypothetical protein